MKLALSLCLAVALVGCKKEEDKESAKAPAPEAGKKADAPKPDKADAPKPDKAEPPPETPEQSMPAVGDAAPAFTTVAHDGTEIDVTRLAGEPFVLYFYPRDETPG